ncbi:MAG TPA: hypothetical protein QF353_01735 [Gammaproteobacteria bacterium]|nr:hypothetical protein [Gammaproteobacteria bacterium]
MRIADKTVYDNENYLSHPKEIHKEIINIVSNLNQQVNGAQQLVNQSILIIEKENQ